VKRLNRDPRGLYAALHVTPDASPTEIQRAFRALMRLRHPDVGAAAAGAGMETGADAGAADDVRRILASFAVLRDPKRRAEYDPGSAGSGQGRSETRSSETRSAERPGGTGSTEIPVRHHRSEQPVLRVTPVQWDRGPW
jgi:curved DNA-binding protein CbpA